MLDETVGAPGGPEDDEAGREGQAPDEQEGSRSGSPHTGASEGHPAGEGERSDRDVGGPTAPENEEEGGTSGGAPGTPPASGFEPHR